MAKRYMVIIPVNKEPYCKSFNDMGKAVNIIQQKLGHMIIKTPVTGFERPMVMFSAHAKKKTELQINERATYFASLPSAEDDIYGPAIIIGEIDDVLTGLKEETALKVIEEINKL